MFNTEPVGHRTGSATLETLPAPAVTQNKTDDLVNITFVLNKLKSYKGTMTYMAPEIKEGIVYDGK